MTKQRDPHAVALGKRGGKIGGRSKSVAKALAAKINGRLGGRPRRNWKLETQEHELRVGRLVQAYGLRLVRATGVSSVWEGRRRIYCYSLVRADGTKVAFSITGLPFGETSEATGPASTIGQTHVLALFQIENILMGERGHSKEQIEEILTRKSCD
jgi:hypothetical protein